MSAAHFHRRPRVDVYERAARAPLPFDQALAPWRSEGKEAHLADRRVPERRSFAGGEAVVCPEEAYTRPRRDLNKR